MGDENPIRTLGDYSKPSHEGYKNTIELPVGNNVVPLRSDTIQLVQNGCSFHGLWSEDPNQHLKYFLKLMESLDLNVGSISTCEDLTTRFLAQFFPLGRTAKLRNDILMFQQHQGESLSEAWTCFKDLLQKVPHHGIDLWLQVQIFYDHVNLATRQTINQSAREGFPTTLSTAWKIPNKPLLNMHPRVSTKRETLQDARLSKFEADFKQQQSEMTNKIDTVLKAITNQMAGALPSDMIKNPKLNVNSTSPVLSVRSYQTPQAGMRIGTQQTKEPEPTLEGEFQDLHLNLPVLEVLAHAPIYNAMLDKYVESLELGKNGSTFVQGENSDKPCVAKAYVVRKEDAVYLLYRSASLRMITAAGGRSYQENSRFLEMYSSISLLTESEYMSAYSFVLVTLGNSYWSLGSCWFHHVPANGCLLGYYWSYDGSSWCLYGSYWLYILIHTGGYELLLVISFLLIGFMVPTGLLMVSSACLFDTICYRC
ncbi:zinc finger, CCHC-type containing protein [Tanacetum coccineum]